MAKRIAVVVSQGQSQNPAKRGLEEDIVAALLMEPGIDVTLIPNLYDLAPDGTGMLALQGIGGNMVIVSWLYPRAAHWTLDRNGIHGQFGETLLKGPEDDAADEDNAEPQEDDKPRVVQSREAPKRTIYCLDLRVSDQAGTFVEEIKRIAAEQSQQVVGLGLMDWVGGDGARPDAMQRFVEPTNDTAAGTADATSHLSNHPTQDSSSDAGGNGSAPAGAPTVIDEAPSRRWYPVIDFSRCTNCMECIDFCLFGVYGVDRAETILVEQPDNCRKGCPACSRVCPENAIIFPQHKTPTIAGSPVVDGGLKIDLSALFGAPDAVDLAARERDEQLVMAGREAVGTSVGIPKRQEGRAQEPKDDLDDLVDALDDLDL